MAKQVTVYENARGTRFDTEEAADISDTLHDLITEVSNRTDIDTRAVTEVVELLGKDANLRNKLLVIADYFQRNRR